MIFIYLLYSIPSISLIQLSAPAWPVIWGHYSGVWRPTSLTTHLAPGPAAASPTQPACSGPADASMSQLRGTLALVCLYGRWTPPDDIIRCAAAYLDIQQGILAAGSMGERQASRGRLGSWRCLQLLWNKLGAGGTVWAADGLAVDCLHTRSKDPEYADRGVAELTGWGCVASVLGAGLGCMFNEWGGAGLMG